MYVSSDIFIGYFTSLGKSSASMGGVGWKDLVTNGVAWQLVSNTITAHYGVRERG